MDGERVRGLHSGLTLSQLPHSARHVRLALHDETPEEKRKRLRAVYRTSDKTGTPSPSPLSILRNSNRFIS